MNIDDDTIARSMRDLQFARLLALAAGEESIALCIFNAAVNIDPDAAYAPLLPMVLGAIERDRGRVRALSNGDVIARLAVTVGDVNAANIERFAATLVAFVDENHADFSASQHATLARALNDVVTSEYGDSMNDAQREALRRVGFLLRDETARAQQAFQTERERVHHESSDAGRAESGWNTFNPDKDYG